MALYEYKWIPGNEVPIELCQEIAELYSRNYGVWGCQGARPGQHIRLSVSRLREWLLPDDSRLAFAKDRGRIIGYAIAVQRRLPSRGVVSWVTQLVVEEAYRQQNVGKTLLFTIWKFSDHFAWGLITANPYAIRALEKATRRRCIPGRIREQRDLLVNLGADVARTYVKESIETRITAAESGINTRFYIDHSHLSEMLLHVSGPERHWQMGPLKEGWEWFAFTFQNQDRIPLERVELEQMLLASDEITKHAYSRVSEFSDVQSWAKHTPAETTFIAEVCDVKRGDSILDLGCDKGRHSIALAERGFVVVGTDYIESAVETARNRAKTFPNVEFVVGDGRSVKFDRIFDAAICLYDVIGSYAEEQENLSILENIFAHVKHGGRVLLSVMNLELTKRRCKNWFSITHDPDQLLMLRPGTLMEKTGNVFDPDFYLMDRDSMIVYRKEQFSAGESLPDELLIRDKRFSKTEIEGLCKKAGFEVLWSRFVRAGGWWDPLPANHDHAKEILVLCRKPHLPPRSLFDLQADVSVIA